MAKKSTTKKSTKRTKAAPKRKSSTTRKKTVKKPAKRTSRSSSPEKQIERIDAELLKLANQRAELTTKLYNESEDPQGELYRPGADEELWNRLLGSNPGPLPPATVKAMFREILSAAKQAVRVQRVAYLGPKLSFSHLASIHRFGKQADLTPVGTIADVFEAVNRRQVEFGLVPIENSTDGRVVDTLEMFTKLPIKICGEVQLVIHHHLLAKCARSEVGRVYSKRQALSQTRTWLQRNMPMATVHEVSSTSAAADLASRERGAAAVASRSAAAEYDLQVLAECIEDNPNNVTRFAVIGHEIAKRSGDDRTSLLFQIKHSPGSLADTLAIFKKNKVNLTWIESFPLRGEDGKYWFFIDFVGHVNDAKTKRTLEALEKKVVLMNVLGSYPRSEPVE